MNDALSLPRSSRIVLRQGEFVPAELFPISPAVARMAMELSAPTPTRPASKRLAYVAPADPARKPASTPAQRPAPTKFVAPVPQQPTKSRRDVNGSGWSLAPVQERREKSFGEIYGARRDTLMNRARRLPDEISNNALLLTIASIRTLKSLMDLERYVKNCEAAAKKLKHKRAPINRFAHK